MPFRVNFNFEQGVNGWTETFYSTRPSNEWSNLVTEIQDIAPIRLRLLAPNAQLVSVGYHDEAAYSDGRHIDYHLYGQFPYMSTNLTQASPYGIAFLARFQTESGKRKSLYMRGIPENVVDQWSTSRTFFTGWLLEWNTYYPKVISYFALKGFSAAIRNATYRRVTQLDADNDRTVLKCGPFPPFAPGDKVIIKGFKTDTSGLVGPKTVLIVDDVQSSITLATPNVSQEVALMGTRKTGVWKYETIYYPLVDAIPVKITTRKTGAPYSMTTGRS